MSHPIAEKEIDEVETQAVINEDDPAYRKLDQRVTRKMDIHILPWIIVCEMTFSPCDEWSDR